MPAGTGASAVIDVVEGFDGAVAGAITAAGSIVDTATAAGINVGPAVAATDATLEVDGTACSALRLKKGDWILLMGLVAVLASCCGLIGSCACAAKGLRMLGGDVCTWSLATVLEVIAAVELVGAVTDVRTVVVVAMVVAGAVVVVVAVPGTALVVDLPVAVFVVLADAVIEACTVLM